MGVRRKEETYMSSTRIIVFSHDGSDEKKKKVTDLTPEVFARQEFGDRAKFDNRRWPSDVVIYNRDTGVNDHVGVIHEVEVVGKGFDGFEERLENLTKIANERSDAKQVYEKYNDQYKKEISELNELGIKASVIASRVGTTQQAVCNIVKRSQSHP